MNIVIAGLAKNCHDNYKKNIEFLIDFKEAYKESLEISILVIENDSKDDTKKIIKKFSENKFIHDYCLDGLDKKLTNRIERITFCRNYLLEKLTNLYSDTENYIYISADFDIDLFSKTPKETFFQILNKINNQNEVTAIFPNTTPYYYDIHALRKRGWNTVDSWKRYNQISKYVPIGKFFLRYVYIYRKQRKIKTKKTFIDVDSAFGGIGIYKLNKLNLSNIKYESDKSFDKCEHIYFNSHFVCAIYASWNIKSPKEHLEFKSLNFLNKIGYILISLIRDFKNLFLYFKKN